MVVEARGLLLGAGADPADIIYKPAADMRYVGQGFEIPVPMPSLAPGQDDVAAIAENFLVPSALRDVGLTEKVAISKEVLEHMLKEYANEETGVRELKRCVEQIAQKINMLRIFNAKELPFYIKDFHLPFVVKKEHIDLFLKKKNPSMDVSVQRMYL
jgi:DNA-binding NtrC family response regulator